MSEQNVAFTDACDPVAVKAVYGVVHLGGVRSVPHPGMQTCSSRTPLEQGFMLLLASQHWEGAAIQRVVSSPRK